MRIVPLLLGAYAALSAELARAFDVNGFRSGMTVEDVQGVGKRLDLEFRHDQSPYMMRKTGPNTYEHAYSFGFCEGKLDWINVSYAGSMAMLIDLIEEMHKKYGASPTANGSSQIARDGRLRSLRIHFPGIQGDRPYITINSYRSDVEFSLGVIHEDPTICPGRRLDR
jgi:hypothetical protein